MARKRWQPKMLRIAQMLVDGYTQQEIAAHLHMNPTSISMLVNSPPFQSYMDICKRSMIDSMVDVQSKLQSAAPLVGDMLIDQAINARDERVRFNAGKAVLEMAGHVPVRRHEIARVHDHSEDKYDRMSKDDIRQSIMDDIENVPERESLVQVGGRKTVH